MVKNVVGIILNKYAIHFGSTATSVHTTFFVNITMIIKDVGSIEKAA